MTTTDYDALERQLREFAELNLTEEVEGELMLEAADALSSLLSEREAMEKDARRYAWLKARCGNANFTDSGIAYLVHVHGSIDAAIDAALAAEKESDI